MDYVSVTEIAGDEVTQEQVDEIVLRAEQPDEWMIRIDGWMITTG